MKNKKYIIFILFCIFTFGKEILPLEKESVENLEINGKYRNYFTTKDNNLHFEVDGPKYYKLISRCAIPQDLNEIVNFRFEIKVGNEYNSTAHHSQKLYKKVKSNKHPGYGYTSSGNDIVYVPAGSHTISLQPIDEKNPIVFRLITHHKHPRNGDYEVVFGLDNQVVHHLKVGNNSLPYTLLDSETNFDIEVEGPCYLDIVSRLVFENTHSESGSYILVVQKDNRDFRTFHLQTEESENSSIIENSEIVPGKWRTNQIKVPNGKHKYSINSDNDLQSVYIRCLKH